MTKIKKHKKNNLTRSSAGENVKQWELSFIAGGVAKCTANSLAVSFKVKHVPAI